MARVLWSGSTGMFNAARVVFVGDGEPLVLEFRSLDSLGEASWREVDPSLCEHVMGAAIKDLAMSATRENGR